MSADIHNANAFSAMPTIRFAASLWFEPVGETLELRLAVSSSDMPALAMQLGETVVLFEPVARVRGQSVYRATSARPAHAESLPPQVVWLTPSGLRQEETGASPGGGIAHA